MRNLFAGVLVCALLHTPSAEANLSYGTYRIDESGTRAVRLFALAISHRQSLVVSVISDDFTPRLYLVSPAKRVWSEANVTSGRASITIDDAVPGEWYVAVRPVDVQSAGEFALTVEPAGGPVPLGPALSSDAKAALMALRRRSGAEERIGLDVGNSRGLQGPGVDAPPDGGDHVAAPSAKPGAKALSPLLPWPPPEPSARMVVPKMLLSNPATLGDVDDRLRAALRVAGYDDLGYFAVPNGFAAVTRLERIEPTGEPVADASRWQMTVPADPSFSLFDYLRALLTAQTGHFRVIAFVVTPTLFTGSPGEVDAVSARRWASTGRNALPPPMRSQVFTADYSVTALVYEFSKIRGERSVHYDLPGDLSATTHLEASGILAALQN